MFQSTNWAKTYYSLGKLSDYWKLSVCLNPFSMTTKNFLFPWNQTKHFSYVHTILKSSKYLHKILFLHI